MGDLQPTLGIGEVWKHHNLRVAYIAQHSMHHLEDHVESSPLAYIQDRFYSGRDKELAKLASLALDDSERELMTQRGEIEAIIGRAERGSKLWYEVMKVGRKKEDTIWEPIEFLAKMAPYVMKLVKNYDEKMKAMASGVDIRPLTAEEVKRHLNDFGINEDVVRSCPAVGPSVLTRSRRRWARSGACLEARSPALCSPLRCGASHTSSRWTSRPTTWTTQVRALFLSLCYLLTPFLSSPCGAHEGAAAVQGRRGDHLAQPGVRGAALQRALEGRRRSGRDRVDREQGGEGGGEKETGRPPQAEAGGDKGRGGQIMHNRRISFIYTARKTAPPAAHAAAAAIDALRFWAQLRPSF